MDVIDVFDYWHRAVGECELAAMRAQQDWLHQVEASLKAGILAWCGWMGALA